MCQDGFILFNKVIRLDCLKLFILIVFSNKYLLYFWRALHFVCTEYEKNDLFVGIGRVVGTGRDLSLRGQRGQGGETEQRANDNVIKIKPVSELMGALKTTSSKQIHLFGNMDFRWQRSFYDHIVRDADRYDNIYRYISENPARWEDDSLKDPDYTIL